MACLSCASIRACLWAWVTQENVTCVLCGCRKSGFWRSPELPGQTVHFLHMVSGDIITNESAFILFAGS